MAAKRKESEVAEQQALFSRYVSAQGLKWTRQRAIISETFFREGTEHLDVEAIVSKVRQLEPTVGHATVYRTLRLLREAGLATEHDFGDGRKRYEVGDGPHHDHLICTLCGSIVEFENERIEALQAAVAKAHGFAITHHKMELYGQCEKCARKRKGARWSRPKS